MENGRHKSEKRHKYRRDKYKYMYVCTLAWFRFRLTSLKYPIHPSWALVIIDLFLAPEEEEVERQGNFLADFHRNVPEYPPSSLPSTSMLALIADVAFITTSKYCYLWSCDSDADEMSTFTSFVLTLTYCCSSTTVMSRAPTTDRSSQSSRYRTYLLT